MGCELVRDSHIGTEVHAVYLSDLREYAVNRRFPSPTEPQRLNQ